MSCVVPDPNVGGGLPPMAVCQSLMHPLTGPHRGQAPSHRKAVGHGFKPAFGRGLGADRSLVSSRSKCGRGLARDGGMSVTDAPTDRKPPPTEKRLATASSLRSAAALELIDVLCRARSICGRGLNRLRSQNMRITRVSERITVVGYGKQSPVAVTPATATPAA